MHMIRHQDVGVNAGFVSLAHAIQEMKISTIVVIDKEDSFTAIATLYDVERHSWNTDAG